ncbi:hypothetical protein BDQ17DRAFT_1326286 [Cyathus striatus]|nr:hypothetical protein BDQ17DRAFT_1326286 [Cyathus striatus]
MSTTAALSTIPTKAAEASHPRTTTLSAIPTTSSTTQICRTCKQSMPLSTVKTCEACRSRDKRYRDNYNLNRKILGEAFKLEVPVESKFKLCQRCRDRAKESRERCAKQKREAANGAASAILQGHSAVAVNNHSAVHTASAPVRNNNMVPAPAKPPGKAVTMLAGHTSWETIGDIASSSPVQELDPESEGDLSTYDMDEDQARQLYAIQVDELDPSEGPSSHHSTSTLGNSHKTSANSAPSHSGSYRPCTFCRGPVSVQVKFKLCDTCRESRREYQRKRTQLRRESQSAAISNYGATTSSASRVPPHESTSQAAEPSASTARRRSKRTTVTVKTEPSTSTTELLQPSSSSKRLPKSTQTSSISTKPVASTSTNPIASSPKQPTTTSRKRGRKPKPASARPASTSGARCSACKAWLPEGYFYKQCDACRDRGRKQQNALREREKAQGGRKRKRRKLDDDDDGVKMEGLEVKMEAVEASLDVVGAGGDVAGGGRDKGDIGFSEGSDVLMIICSQVGGEHAMEDTGRMDVDAAVKPPVGVSSTRLFSSLAAAASSALAAITSSSTNVVVPVNATTPVDGDLYTAEKPVLVGAGESEMRVLKSKKDGARGIEEEIITEEPAANSIPTLLSQQCSWSLQDPDVLKYPKMRWRRNDNMETGPSGVDNGETGTSSVSGPTSGPVASSELRQGTAPQTNMRTTSSVTFALPDSPLDTEVPAGAAAAPALIPPATVSESISPLTKAPSPLPKKRGRKRVLPEASSSTRRNAPPDPSSSASAMQSPPSLTVPASTTKPDIHVPPNPSPLPKRSAMKSAAGSREGKANIVVKQEESSIKLSMAKVKASPITDTNGSSTPSQYHPPGSHTPGGHTQGPTGLGNTFNQLLTSLEPVTAPPSSSHAPPTSSPAYRTRGARRTAAIPTPASAPVASGPPRECSRCAKPIPPYNVYRFLRCEECRSLIRKYARTQREKKTGKSVKPRIQAEPIASGGTSSATGRTRREPLLAFRVHLRIAQMAREESRYSDGSNSSADALKSVNVGSSILKDKAESEEDDIEALLVPSVSRSPPTSAPETN